LSCQLAFHPCSLLIYPSSVVQKIGTLQTAVTQRDKIPIHHVNKNNKWKPRNSQGTETDVIDIFITFPATYFDSRHVSIGLAPSTILTFSASSFLISTSHVRDQRLNVLWQFPSVLPRLLYIGLHKTSTLTTYKEVLFISFLSRWQIHKGGDSKSVRH
jgi:hypothetical protein